MRLTVLGCDGSWPGPGGASSGYLLEHDDGKIVLDFGSGVMARYQSHAVLADLDAIFITHAHPDHFVDLYPLSIALHYGRRAPGPVPLFAPDGFAALASTLLVEGTREAWEGAFATMPIEPGTPVHIGPFEVTAHPMAHLAGSVGYRVTAGGRSLAYTGDTGPTDAVTALARNADLLLCEATHLDGGEADFHLTAGQAGAHAARAEVGTLVLTHLEPGVDPSLAAEQARRSFDGDVVAAESGMVREV